MNRLIPQETLILIQAPFVTDTTSLGIPVPLKIANFVALSLIRPSPILRYSPGPPKEKSRNLILIRRSLDVLKVSRGKVLHAELQMRVLTTLSVVIVILGVLFTVK